MTKTLLCMTVAGCLAVGQVAPKAQKATARELFLEGLEEVAPSNKAKPAAPKPSTTVTTGTQKTRAIVPMRKASYHGPLGLRYSLVKVDGPNSLEIAPKSEFRSGDAIRLKVRANDAGYLYIVHQGTSGNWQVLFPLNKSKPDSNRIEAGVDYTVPPNSLFRFKGAAGTERLFVLLTRVPERDIQEIIYSVKGRSETPGHKGDSEPELLASNAELSNPLIKRLRAYSRDLVLEDEPTETVTGKDFGVYVVNTKGVPDSRVVVDIELRHK